MIKGLFITAAEMRDAGIPVNENIADHTIYHPTTAGQLQERVSRVIHFRDGEEADGKCAEAEGDMILASFCRRSVEEIDVVLAAWRERWGLSPTETIVRPHESAVPMREARFQTESSREIILPIYEVC